MAWALSSSWQGTAAQDGVRRGGTGGYGTPPIPPRGPYLGLLLGHHVQLLLAHPGLGLGGVAVELLGGVGALQALVPQLRLQPQLLPGLPQLPHPLGRARQPPAPPQQLLHSRLVALQLLLQRLQEGEGDASLGVLPWPDPLPQRSGPPDPTWFFLMSSWTEGRSLPWSVETARGLRSFTHSCGGRGVRATAAAGPPRGAAGLPPPCSGHSRSRPPGRG